MLCRCCSLCSRRNRKINIVLGERGGEMFPKHRKSNITAKCLNTFVAHCSLPFVPGLQSAFCTDRLWNPFCCYSDRFHLIFSWFYKLFLAKLVILAGLFAIFTSFLKTKRSIVCFSVVSQPFFPFGILA